MGWRGTVRSIGSAVRAAERDAKRRQRELEKREKEYAKMQELEQSAYEVEVYENHIELIQSLHKECSARIDWKEVSEVLKPAEPNRSSEKESLARDKEKNYSPNLLDKILNRENKKRQKLKENLSAAQTTDEQKHEEKQKEWRESLADWEDSQKHSRLLLDGDNDSKIKVIEELNPFSEISNLGSKLSAYSVESCHPFRLKAAT